MKALRIFFKIGKILLWVLLSVVILVVLLLATAKVFENKITHIAMNEVSQMIKAPVKCDTVSLLLLRKFPYATVEFKGFKLGATTDTINFGKAQLCFDTLFSFDRVYVSIKTMPLLKSEFEVKMVELAGIRLNYAVDSMGVTNFDFLISSDTTKEETPMDDTTKMVLNVLLKDLTLSDIAIAYKDDKMKAQALVSIPKIHLEGKIIDDYYAGLLQGRVELHGVRYEGFNLDLMRETSLDFDLNYDNGKADVNKVQLLSDGLKLVMKGVANVADTIFVDMNMRLSDMNFNELSKYAPEKMLNEFGLREIKGMLNVDANIKGFYHDSTLLPAVEAKINLDDCRVITRDYPALEKVAVAAHVSVPNAYNLNTVTATVKSFLLKTPKSRVEMSAKVRNIDQPIYDLKANMFLHLNEFASLIPEGTVKYLTGDVSARLQTSGQLPKNLGMSSADYFLGKSSLDISLLNISTALDSATEVKNLFVDFTYRPNKTFSISNLSLNYPSMGVDLGKSLLRGKILGRVSDMDNMGANIDSFYFQLGNSNLGGRAYLLGLVKPKFDVNATLNVVIDDMIRQFVPDSLVDDISGKVSLALKTHGEICLDSIADQAIPIAFEQSDIKLAVRDFNVDMFGDTLVKINNFKFDFAMKDDTIRIDNLHGVAHGIDFWMDSTQIWNAYKAYMLKQPDKKLIAQTHIRLGDIDYAKFAHIVEDSTQKDTTSAKQPEPADTAKTFIPHFIARGTFAVNTVRYNKNFIEDIALKFRVDDSLYVIDDFRLKTFGGEMITSAVYDMRCDTVDVIELKNEIKGMDIHKLLKDNDDFGMSQTISHKNISGILTSQLSAKVPMRDTVIHYDRINVLGDFELVNGGIYNFKPIMDMGKFTGMKELEHINFKTLKTNLFIFKNKIYIPKTDIVSTALDLTAYGMQSFGKEYEYHAVIHLSDVLFGKSKNLMKKQGLEGDITSGDGKNVDRNGLYLVTMENRGINKTGFDTKQLQRKMETTIKVQHAILGVMFHPKMVNFKTELDRSKNVKKPEQKSEGNKGANTQAVPAATGATVVEENKPK